MCKLLFKIGKHIDFHLSSFQIMGLWQDFYSCHKTDKNFKSLYGFGGCWLTITDVCMDFEPCFMVHKFVSVYSESIKLGQMTNLTVIFHLVVSDFWLLKIWNYPQFPVQPRTTNKVDTTQYSLHAMFKLEPWPWPNFFLMKNMAFVLHT